MNPMLRPVKTMVSFQAELASCCHARTVGSLGSGRIHSARARGSLKRGVNIMRLLFAIAIPLFTVGAYGGELPRDPMVQLLVNGQSAPIEMGSDYLFGHPELSLADAAASSGGVVRREGKGDYSSACVTHDGTTKWLLSDASDRDGEPFLTAMVVSRASPEVANCTSVAEFETAPLGESGIPGIGDDLSAIAERFGPTEVSEEGLVAFRSHDLLGDGGDSWELIKTVTYHLADDVVDAVAYEVVTVH